jgi:hypothetical protein
LAEHIIQSRILKEASKLGARVFRNNVGVAWNKIGNPIRFGLAVGSADIIGIYKGKFLSIEVKRPGKKLRKEQQLWLDMVNKHGGIAIVCDDEKKLKSLLDDHPNII